MSKSNPDSAVFMDDTTEEISRKLSKAWCPERQIEENPVLEYCKYIIFERFECLKIERPEKFGGDIEFNSYAELEKSYAAGQVHPMDLKKAVAKCLDALIVPVRKHFEKGEPAKLLEQVKSFTVTR